MKTPIRFFVPLVILTCCVALASSPVPVAAAPQFGDDGAVHLKEIKVMPEEAQPGDTVTVTITVETDAGWHVYGAMQNPENGPPIALTIDGADGLTIAGGSKIPTGKKHDSFGMETFWVVGRFDIVQKLEVPADAKPGKRAVTGSISYQICNDSVCLPPTEFSVSIPVNVVAGEGVAAPAAGGAVTAVPAETEAARVRVTGTKVKSPAKARAGELAELEASIWVSPIYHVYGSLQDPKNGAPITLEITPTRGIEAVGSTDSPPGEEHELEFGGMTHWVVGSFEIRRNVRIPAGLAPGDYKIAGEVVYTVCDDNQCYFDDPIPVSFMLSVEAGEMRPEYSAASALPGTNGAAGSESEDDDPVSENPLWAFILLAIGGGLFALVMPCTYPMIPITMSFFTKQAAERGGNVLPLSLAYGFGIVGIFVAIALVFGTLIIDFAQHPVTNTVIGIIFVVFALSLFGVFILQPPAFLMNAAGRASNVGGYLGVFLMGTALVVTSFTCTAPFVGVVLSVGATGEGASVGRVALGMGVFGLTMAIPFVILSLVPGRLQKMPRSGEWMNTIKVFLGFVELAAAWKFFSNAEYVWQLMILPRELFFLMWAGTFGLAAAFLLGWINLKGEVKDGIGSLRMSIGVFTAMFAIYCAFAGMGNRVDWVMTAIAPPYSAHANVLEETGEQEAKLYVENDYGKALNQARKEGKQLLVNFTGYT